MGKHAISQLHPHKDNPRKISGGRLNQLKRTMAEFGDLGGIVRNVHPSLGGEKDGVLIGGHQRVQAYRDSKDAEVVLEKRYDNPTKAGTVAEGYVLIDGERFAYREVHWLEAKAKAAMLAANKSAGEFDVTGLTAIINDLNGASYDLTLTMFDQGEIQAYLPDEKEISAMLPSYEDSPAMTQTAEVADVPAKSSPNNKAPSNHVKMVQLFYKDDEHQKFVELTDLLKELYGRSNLSDTVIEAIKRASVTAALK